MLQRNFTNYVLLHNSIMYRNNVKHELESAIVTFAGVKENNKFHF